MRVQIFTDSWDCTREEREAIHHTRSVLTATADAEAFQINTGFFIELSSFRLKHKNLMHLRLEYFNILSVFQLVSR